MWTIIVFSQIHNNKIIEVLREITLNHPKIALIEISLKEVLKSRQTVIVAESS